MPGRSMTLLTAAALWTLVPVAAQAQSQASELPEGAGKELVEGVCTACHETNQITRSSGYTREDWQELTGTMVDLSGSPEDQAAIVDYLATHFPPNTERAPKLMPGDAEIAFKEWVVPTLGQRSRDPVEAADGSIWWAGQWGNLIGRIDPATGEMTEYPLPASAMPHTVVLDAAGNVWYTGNKNGTVGKLDPGTGEITEYKMPDPAAKDPHTAVFDEDGHPLVHPAAEQHGRPARPGERRGQAGHHADRRMRGPTASRSTPTGPPGSPATAATAWSRSTRRRWTLTWSSCRSRRPRCGASTSPATA